MHPRNLGRPFPRGSALLHVNMLYVVAMDIRSRTYIAAIILSVQLSELGRDIRNVNDGIRIIRSF